MSQAATQPMPAGDDANAPHVRARAKLNEDQMRFAPGTGSKLYVPLGVLGVILIAATLLVGMMGGSAKQAMGAYHVGVMLTLYLSIGGLALVMILQQFNAGWAVTVRRPLEALGSIIPLCFILFIPILLIEIFSGGLIFKWMDPALTDPKSSSYDVLAAHKKPFLNTTFFAVRVFFYFGLWSYFGWRLWGLSRRQDETGDKWLTARARYLSSFGIPLVALTAAFASFDWMMSLDFHWYSTMFGVYFFAGALMSTVAVLALVLSVLKQKGKLGDAVNAEHLHDVGKLLLSFTVFWGYIAFGQYFLIWYSNIPEESAWFWLRQQEATGWKSVFILLCFGHFLIPFLYLLFRRVKRTAILLSIAAVWLLIMHVVDVLFIIKPALGKPGAPMPAMESVWLDVLGLAGPVCLFTAALIWRITSSPLIPIKDPRLHESLAHKNVV